MAGVPRGQVKGPFHLPSQAYPGTQHTYWVYVPAQYDPAGPACHTGERSCFYRDLEGTADPGADAPGVVGEPTPLPYEALATLERTLLARQRRRPEGSYTVELLEDPRLAGDKVREEAAEVVKAVSSESEERVAEEGADVVYHLAVLLLSRGLSMAEVLHVLNGRRRSG